MAVKRVIGRANGFDIIFERGEGNWWNITIPSDLSGEYVVEICAEDEAGNIDFLCRMMFAICGHELQARFLDGGFAGAVAESGYAGAVGIRDFLAGIQVSAPVSKMNESRGYAAAVQKGGYGVERIICSRDVH